MSKSHEMANKLVVLSEQVLTRRRKDQGMKAPTYGQVIEFTKQFVEELTDGQWADLGKKAGYVREDGRRQRIREDTKERVKAIVKSLTPTEGAPFEKLPS